MGPRKQARLLDTAGPEPGTPPAQTRLAIGVIVGSHGVRGEAKLRLFTDEPEHLRAIKRIWLGDEPNPRRLLGVRFQNDVALIRVQGITTPEAVAELRGETVRIAGADARPLAPGELFLYQLIGLDAFDEAGAPVGRVTDIIETGANDVLVIAPPDGGPDILLPNHPETVLDVRPGEGRMTVRRLVYGN
ncbi:MAG TPA: ribosome maturation factor RimM [Thermomicrobiales bacterium]|nr:ribosome maturation factor RimM [Thermomicrobiales bacterium]